MNIAELSIKKQLIVWMVVVLTVFGGINAYFHLARFEDPEYTIKEAIVSTPYPGASPKEVEEEVTDKVESAIQQLGQVKLLWSTSKEGMSEINVEIKDKYTRKDLPQIWDELRRKVNDIQTQLPPGAGPSIVNDDYSDVYGIFYALTGDGYSYRELEDYSDMLEKQLLRIPGIAKVAVAAKQQEAIFLDISLTKLAQLGLSPDTIYRTLRNQNVVVYSGDVKVGDEYIAIQPTGSLNSVESIGNLLIKSPISQRLIYLSDIAHVSRGYVEVPHTLMYFNGKPALGIGISLQSGGNMVKVGEAVNNKITELQSVTPAGMKLNVVYDQPAVVKKSVNGFLINLIEAIAIVIVVLLFAMGLRSGLIIGAILLLTVLATLALMHIFNIALQRISLGALVIALGMLVDNAIVVVEGVLIKMEQGGDAATASHDIVAKTMWPLLGATIIGILAFAGIGLSQDSTGEYIRSLFQVVLISLLLSWVFAVTIAPVFCVNFLKVNKQAGDGSEPYQSRIYRLHRGLLNFCLHKRWLTVIVMVGALFASVYGFGLTKQSFFPDATTPIFYVNFWRSQGTDIRSTDHDMKSLASYIKKMPEVTDVTSVVGSGALRFMLVYAPEKADGSYGQLIVRVKDYHKIPELIKKIKPYIVEHYPDSEPTMKRVVLGTGGTEDIEARFIGNDPKVLRKLAHQAEEIMRHTPHAVDVRDDWRQPVKVVVPEYSENLARSTGITRADLSEALTQAFSGLRVGIYRERDHLIPIISRPPDNERLNISSINHIHIWSPLLFKSVPIEQVVSGFKTEWRDAIVMRRYRIPTITVSANASGELAPAVFKRMQAKIEAIKLPNGYKMEWGGEHESSVDAKAGLSRMLPLSFLMMAVIMIILFNAIRQPIIICLCLPMAFIGVTIGLLLTNSAFDFMALLGFLSLIGMLIKNAIILLDQIHLDIVDGKPPYQAVVDSSISRMRPIVLAALTTIMGMTPLLFDVFFKNMAVVIMFGLAFATLLTLFIVPVLYVIFFKVKAEKSVG